MLLAVAGVLLVLWIGGFLLNVVGNVIHAVLVVAVIVFIAHFFMGKRGRAV